MVSGPHVFAHVEHLAPAGGIEWDTMQAGKAQTQIISAIVGSTFRYEGLSGEGVRESHEESTRSGKGGDDQQKKAAASPGRGQGDESEEAEEEDMSDVKMRDLLPIVKLQVATALCVPIMRKGGGKRGGEGTPVGVMMVLKEAMVHDDSLTAQPHEYSSGDIDILQAYCHQLPPLVEAINLRENQLLIARAYEAETINRHGAETLGTQEGEVIPVNLIRSSLDEVNKVLEADGARLFVKEEEAKGREPGFIMVESEKHGGHRAPRAVPLGRGVAWRTMNRQRSLLIHLARAERHLHVDAMIDCDSGGDMMTASLASCPLVIDLIGCIGTVQVARACENSRLAYSWHEMAILERLAAKVATTLSMQTLRKTSTKFEERLKSLAHVWDNVEEPVQAMERTLHNMRRDFSADVCSLYEVTQIADSTVLLLRGVASGHHVELPEQVPLKGILGTVVLDMEPIVASRDNMWGWDCPQFNPGIDLPLSDDLDLPEEEQKESTCNQIMAIPLRDPKQTNHVIGVVSLLRGHDGSGGSQERFGEDELLEAPVNIGLLVQLLTWAGTESRHSRSHDQRKRLMDVIMLIADTQDANNHGGNHRKRSSIAPNGDTTDEKAGSMRLDELLELARVSLAAQVAALHIVHKSGLLHMDILKRGKPKVIEKMSHEYYESSDDEYDENGISSVGKGDMASRKKKAIRGSNAQHHRPRKSNAALEEEDPGQTAQEKLQEGLWEDERKLRRCSIGQGIIGYCALTLETINTELGREAKKVPETWSDSPVEEGRLTDPENQLDIGVDIPPGVTPQPMAICCIPIIDVQGDCVGVLEVLNKESSFKGSVVQFTGSDITIMRILSTAFAMAMQEKGQTIATASTK